MKNIKSFKSFNESDIYDNDDNGCGCKICNCEDDCCCGCCCSDEDTFTNVDKDEEGNLLGNCRKCNCKGVMISDHKCS